VAVVLGITVSLAFYWLGAVIYALGFAALATVLIQQAIAGRHRVQNVLGAIIAGAAGIFAVARPLVHTRTIGWVVIGIMAVAGITAIMLPWRED
jgi:hypothetical protein